MLPSRAAFSSIYVIGDSLSAEQGGGTQYPPPPGTCVEDYWNGRYSNGPIWVEYLANLLEIRLDPHRNFSCFGNGSTWIQRTLTYGNFFPGPDFSTALCVYWPACSDCFALTVYAGTNNWAPVLPRFISAFTKTIDTLYSDGMRAVLIPNSVDVSLVPFFTHTLPKVGLGAVAPNGIPSPAAIRAGVIQYNAALADAIAQLRSRYPDLTIYAPDFYTQFNYGLSHPEEYELTKRDIDALEDSELTDKAFNGPGADYGFWDYLHPTTKVHAFMAAFAAESFAGPKVQSAFSRSADLRLALPNLPAGRLATLAQKGLAAPAPAQMSEQIVKSFGNPLQSGSSPVGVLMGTDGLLYGMTRGGGIYRTGTVFRVRVDGSHYTILHAFGGSPADGAAPQAGLVQGRDGNLYGATTFGGANKSGTVFKLATDGSGYSILHTCGNGGLDNDGSSPTALIQGADGWVYGVAQEGGDRHHGALFKLQTDGSSYQILHHFGNLSAATDLNEDGLTPVALTQGLDGRLYGVTSSGGTNGNVGIVFSLGSDGTGFTLLHTFGAFAEDGTRPVGVAQASNGLLVGVTHSGGSSGNGVVFVLNADGSGYALRHQFTGKLGDGANPGAGLLLGRDGACYGITVHGGADDGAEGFGTVFRMSADGSCYRVIRRFNFVDSMFYQLFSTDGQEPGALTQGSDGTLYGVTAYGGATGRGIYQETGEGTLFALATDGTSYSVLHHFSTTGGDGGTPAGGLALGRDGRLHGITSVGGAAGKGAVFSIDPRGLDYRLLYGFGMSPIDGLSPQGGLTVGTDGTFYGATLQGGYTGGSGDGIVFKLQPDGSRYAAVLSFGFYAPGGRAPEAPPVQGRDGNLYGVTSQGGYALPGQLGQGTIYSVGGNGLGFTILHQFSTNGLEGSNPLGGLMQGSDGALYGTSYGSGLIGNPYAGTVFKVLTNGSGFQVLHTFANNSADGGNPSAALILDLDGFLYGTTENGGARGFGTVFKLRTDGSEYQVLHHFGSEPDDGQLPKGPVTLGSDGYLYGTTFYGGAFGPEIADHRGYGVVFRLDATGSSYTVLYNFGSKINDGHLPLGGLVQGLDGAFYGATTSGGENDAGTVFRLGTTPFAFTSIRPLPNKTVSLALSGPSGTTCRIEASTDLSDWTTLTNLFHSAVDVQWIDLEAERFAQRFYRAYQVP